METTDMPDHPLDLSRLLRHEPIGDVPPFSGGDEAAIDEHIKKILGVAEKELEAKSIAEFGHYGSGYASFVDAWLYRETDEFRMGAGDQYCGLIVLLSRLTNGYVLGEGSKSWSGGGSASYLPCFDQVDRFDHPAVRDLAGEVEPLLSGFGWTRLSRESVEDFLPADLEVPTILTDPPFRVFDAIFHWED